MKSTTLLASSSLIAAISLLTYSSPAALITGLFNTGVNGGGHVLGVGQAEQHYLVTGASTQAYIVPRVYHNPGNYAAWVEAPAGSAWIGPNITDSTWPGDPVGTYTYSLVLDLDLTGYDLSRVRLSGYWATDNSGEIWLNGVYTGFNTHDWGFAQLSPFLLQTGFKEGKNSLEFKVLNSGSAPNPSGLLVANLRGSDDGSIEIPPPVPEPSTVITAALLLLPLCLGAKRLRRS